MNNIGLFFLSALIWGSTWLMITFQLGTVDPLISVVYRFSLASIILLIFCFFTKKTFNFSWQDHQLIFLQGLFLFGFSYWLSYLGVAKMNSALAAILSTTTVYFNVVFARLVLGDKIKSEVVLGATIGTIGIILLFMPELEIHGDSKNIWSGAFLVIVGSGIASLGNILSSKTQRRNIPIIQANALGMGYAGILLTLVALVSGYQFNFEYTFEYIGSLIYLALFGSVIAFGAFLKVLGNIGADKAGYVSLIYPVIAMILSSFFENYQWTLAGIIGLVIILIGNFIAMGKHKNYIQRIKNH